jgi:hypothetical protein
MPENPASHCADDCSFDSRWLGAVIRHDTWHFHRRLYERYGVVLAPGEFSGIKKVIETGKAILVKRRGAKFAVYRVELRDRRKPIYVVASSTGLPVTVFPQCKKTMSWYRSALGDVHTDYVLRWRLLAHRPHTAALAEDNTAAELRASSTA